MATATFPPPAAFDFAQPQEWPRWKKRFMRYRETTALDKKEDEIQISTLIYAMGDKAEDILGTITLTADEKKSFTVVLQKLEDHFVKKRNVIYERARFNQRSQHEGEPVDDFITSLYKLSEFCEFGALREDLIRDRIVVGLQDTRLSEKLQLDGDLSLEKAVRTARQSEAVKQQQKSLRSPFQEEPSGEIAAVQSKRRPPKKQEPQDKLQDKRADTRDHAIKRTLFSVRTIPFAQQTELSSKGSQVQ